MLKRPKSRLVAAVAAAGTICALGAAAAASASTADAWSGRIGPVPQASTNASPGLTSVNFGNSPVTQTLVAWKGQLGEHVFYEASPTLGPKTWSAKADIPGADTTAAPAIASYRDPNGRNAVLAVWRGDGGLIHYAQGETEAGQKIVWTRVATLPKSIYSTTDAAPAVFFALDRYVAVVAYRGPFDHIRYIEGVPARRGFKWSDSHEVSSTAVSSSGPAIAEQQTSTGHGTIFVFWKGHGTNQINYATTSDPLAAEGKVAWTVTALSGAVTSATPAASALGLHGTGGLLLAYKAPHAAHVLYQTLAGGTWSGPLPVPSSSTVYGPTLLRGELATTSAAGAGSIFFHVFS